MPTFKDLYSIGSTLYEGKTAIQIVNEQVADCQWRIESDINALEKDLASLREQVKRFKLLPRSTNTPVTADLTNTASRIESLLFAIESLDAVYYNMVKALEHDARSTGQCYHCLGLTDKNKITHFCYTCGMGVCNEHTRMDCHCKGEEPTYEPLPENVLPGLMIKKEHG